MGTSSISIPLLPLPKASTFSRLTNLAPSMSTPSLLLALASTFSRLAHS
eukprot:CAMPEP_0178755346 /NCGR_PEP_ID=MMETSP0744-20121128/12672_1 /TAXON_ID=913974 /ORGANISM="Nitzschia punctata, Strain CCMP561" /LENGTH=48 /DNA_ID= /DNA_START= /DNA_END= /DNA_ORIENTATION=